MIYDVSIFNTKFSVCVAPGIQKTGITIMLISTFVALYGQQYKDYIGAGHNAGVTITASSQSNGTTAARTMDGSGQRKSV